MEPNVPKEFLKATSTAVELIPIPELFRTKVVINREDNAVYIDRRHAGDPSILTWIDRNKSIGISLLNKPVDVDELSKLRMRFGSSNHTEDAELINRNLAIEIIHTASLYKASDVHIMMKGDYSEIQIVVKGNLRVLRRLSQEEGRDLVRAIYQGLSRNRDSSFNDLEFQNAQIAGEDLPSNINVTSVRIVRGPCYPQDKDGSFMTMRLQYANTYSITETLLLPKLEFPSAPEGEFNLVNMGWDISQTEKLKKLMDAPNGVIIFTGPTGSGKTTAIFEALQEIGRTKPHKRLVTTEDPVEFPMPWGVQLSVTNAKNDAETGAAFGERIRVMLRMAPHYILLGEMRGPEVALAAFEAAVTGHSLWSTLHVTDPFLAVERLELMDQVRLNRKIFCDHKILRGLIATRLLAKLCPACSKPLSSSPAALPTRLVKSLETWGDISLIRIRGDGCESCSFDGTLGRFGVAEVVVTDADLMSDFIEHGTTVARKNHREKPDSDPSMLDRAIKLCLKGVVDPRTIEESIDLIESKKV